MNYLDIFIQAIFGTFNWIISLIKLEGDWHQNYFYGLIVISLLVWGLEMLFPWRKNQSIIRKDFWLDVFYMFFNFFVFTLLIAGFYAVFQQFFKDVLGLSMGSVAIVNINQFPFAVALLLFFVLNDFVQWFTHVLLHKFPVLWEFHKVHHSVQEMGFAAHLRYHWMENLFYKPLKTLVVMLVGGFEPEQAYLIHFFAITIGHLNHANVKNTWGPLKYLFNNSVMHLWHHVKSLPESRQQGVNFGISLSIWDYIFKTNYIPSENGDIELGFDDIEKFPTSFLGQAKYGFKKEK